MIGTKRIEEENGENTSDKTKMLLSAELSFYLGKVKEMYLEMNRYYENSMMLIRRWRKYI